MPKRVDANQKEIVKVLRQVGASVQILSDVGKGCPDIVMGFRGRNYLIEIKDGNKPPSGRKLTPPEEEFFFNWRGQACIIYSAEEALQFIDMLRQDAMDKV